MKITETELPGVFLIEPLIFKDGRGHFLEIYHHQRYCQDGIPETFVQANLSYSVGNVLRGLHYQLGRPQGKLVMVLRGEIFDVAVDIRRGSPTYGKWTGVTLSSDTYQQIYVPPGFMHGFCVLSAEATVVYKCTDYYDAAQERGILWNDPTLAIEWPITDPVLSPKDEQHPKLADVSWNQLPEYRVAR